eukprot:c18456_g1_i2.p1 GENE.c18456_g1_i2~~c18456_g1_i2.p1  ORF type:complete len:274 (-),score=108.82 c18456_g1_i2:38-859(-)
MKKKKENFIGVCYLDLLDRPHKYSNAAHFTVRCGRYPKNGSPQTPIVALVFRFGSSIDISDVETLFHEFGHALHSLLSRTETQHLSGTRSSIDYAETPSHFFEYFVSDPRTIPLFVRNVATGEPASQEICQKIIQSKKMFRSLRQQQQVFFSALDYSLHSSTSPLTSDSISSISSEMEQKHKSTTYVQGAHPETAFGHLSWYGGSYYSYLWSQILAQKIWEKYFLKDPLSEASGDHIWKNLLAFGGARDPSTLVGDILGFDLSTPFWKRKLDN